MTQTQANVLKAETLMNRYLADANEAGERGNKAKEAKFLDKCQYWLDRYNKLTGSGE